jgi:hypothetical protein
MKKKRANVEKRKQNRTTKVNLPSPPRLDLTLPQSHAVGENGVTLSLARHLSPPKGPIATGPKVSGGSKKNARSKIESSHYPLHRSLQRKKRREHGVAV